jgi:hypothetical protein
MIHVEANRIDTQQVEHASGELPPAKQRHFLKEISNSDQVMRRREDLSSLD